MRPTVADYRHTQSGSWGLILLPFGVVALAIAAAARHEPVALFQRQPGAEPFSRPGLSHLGGCRV